MKNRLIVALDNGNHPTDAISMFCMLRNHAELFKVGSSLFTRGGPDVVRSIGPERVFLDLKWKDKPEQVAKSVEAAAHMRVKMVTVHCDGGLTMMRAAAASAKKNHWFEGQRPLVFGVTVLTSMDHQEVEQVTLSSVHILDRVKRLAEMAVFAGLDGVVCSGHEIRAVREVVPREFLVITPGIRRDSDNTGDQMRVIRPWEAIAAGANYIVVGEPIYKSENPAAEARDFVQLMEMHSSVR